MEELFVYLCHYHREYNYPPTLREMAEIFFMSPGTVTRYLDKMEAAGWIARDWGKARSITILRTCGSVESGQPKEK